MEKRGDPATHSLRRTRLAITTHGRSELTHTSSRAGAGFMILFKTSFSSHHSSIASGPVHELIALPVLSPFRPSPVASALQESRAVCQAKVDVSSELASHGYHPGL